MKENSRDIDSELIKKAKKGNHGAFNILMNKYYPRVYASIFSFIKSTIDSLALKILERTVPIGVSVIAAISS